MNLRKRFFFIFSLFFHLASAVVYGQDELLEIDAASESLVAKLPGISVSSSGVNARSRVDNQIYGLAEDDKAFLVHDYVRGHTPYIDFVYMTGPLFKRVRSAEFIYDGFATLIRDPRRLSNFCHPSDHYPILITMKF
ncbi:metal-dependent hydrolase [Bacteroides sp. CAG:709]|nr:metal-dependent hydrolase [Bacteroides sp. CAG:709]